MVHPFFSFPEFSQYLSLFFPFFFFHKHSVFTNRSAWLVSLATRMNFKRAGPCHFFEHEQEEVEWPYGSRRTGQIFEQTLGKRSTLLWLVNAARRFKKIRLNHLLCDSRFLISSVRDSCLREKRMRAHFYGRYFKV